jgi:hypothetical protein
LNIAIELALFFSGIIIGWIITIYYHRKQEIQSKATDEIVRQLRQHAGAQIRVGNEKQGKIVERSDGSIVVEWSRSQPASVTVTAQPKVEVIRRSQTNDEDT